MKGLRIALPVVAIATVLAVPATSAAAPVPVHLSIGSNAQYLGPTDIIVPVSLTCPAGQVAFVSLSVQEQNATNATGSGFISNIMCTGSRQTLAVAVTGTGFTPGKAYASGFACTFFCEGDFRQIQIVV